MSRFITSEHAQLTPGWFADRAGKATGSRAADILAKIKSGEAAARRDYRTQLVVERLTGTPDEQGFVSKEMQWGIDQEPNARLAYEASTSQMVRESGFVYLPTIPAGCSVDGFIDGDTLGIWECKCPKSATHLKYLTGGVLPSDYAPQVLHNMWVTGASFAVFTSFDPRMPENLQLFSVRVDRDEAKIKEYEIALMTFLAEVKIWEDELRRKAA